MVEVVNSGDAFSMRLPPTPEGVRLARVAVGERVEEWGFGAHVPAAVLVTSELVSNAVRLAPRTVRLDLDATDRTVRIAVRAEGVPFGNADPPPRDVAEQMSLAVVAAFSRKWGLQRGRDGHDMMWLELGGSE